MNSPDGALNPKGRRWGVAGVAIVVVVGAGGAWFALTGDHDRTTTNVEAMASRAQQVMPFDLNRTTHTFAQTTEGGVQKVTVNDPADTQNLALIRSHLRDEAEQFRNGNYSDPAKIHGMDMAGVKDLEQGAARVSVVYDEIPGGAQVSYTSTEPALVTALHAWFDRQSTDHAMPGMGG
jgi:hypothetical protein